MSRVQDDDSQTAREVPKQPEFHGSGRSPLPVQAVRWDCDHGGAVAWAAAALLTEMRPSEVDLSAFPTVPSTWGSRSNRVYNDGTRYDH